MSIKPHPTKGADWWYIIIPHGRKGSPGYEPPEYIPFQGTKVEALAFERELRGLEPENSRRVKVIDLLARFLDWHKTNMAPKTYEDCQAAFRQLLPFMGDKYIAYIKKRDYEPFKSARLGTVIVPKRRNPWKTARSNYTPETDEEYAARCQADSRMVSKRTVQIELNYFRTFLRWCETEEKMTVGEYPTAFAKSQTKAKSKVVLAPVEIPALGR